MAKLGLERREVAEDNLAGQAQIKPVFLRGGGITAPRKTPVPQAISAAGAMVNALGNFASEQLQSNANARNKRAEMDGQIKAAQGEAFTSAEIQGNPHMAQGWALMNGKATSSTMFAAQVKQIEHGGYAMSAEEFRANYSARLEDAVRGQPEAVATAISDEFSAQMPALVEKHAVKHLEHLEAKNFDALVTSIDAISRDPTGEDALVNFAMEDEASASSMLSPERKQAAISRGVVSAFVNNNPLAYGILRKNGLLDNLTLEQRNSVEAAKTSFQARMRSQANETLVAGVQDIWDQIDSGNLKQHAAAMRMSELLAEHDIEITHQEQAALYERVRNVENTEGMTLSIQLESALLAKDYTVAANITGDGVIEFVESNDNLYAIGPLIKTGANAGDQAQGSMQVMPKTMANPGFGMQPIGANSTPEQKRQFGLDYWEIMYKGKASGFGLTWEPGDIEAAAIAYNAGPGNAKKWIAAGRNYNVLPRTKDSLDYWRKVKARMENMKHPTVNAKYNTATALLSAAKETARVKATDVYNQLAIPVFEAYKNSDGGAAATAGFRAGMDQVREEAGLVMSAATVGQENARQAGILSVIRTNQDKAEAERQETAYTGLMMNPLAEWRRVQTDVNATREEKSASNADLLDAQTVAFEEAGIFEVNTRLTKLFNKMSAMDAQMLPKIRERQINLAEQANAIKNRSMASLSPANRDEAMRTVLAHVDQAVGEALIGVEDPAQRAQIADAAFATAMLEYSYVPAEITEGLSASILRGSLVDKNDKPRPAALEAIQKYIALRDMDTNQVALEQLLTEPARAIAERVINAAGPGGNIAEAMQWVGRALDNVPTKQEVDVVVRSLNMEDDIRTAVEARTEQDIISYFGASTSPRADFSQVGLVTPSEQASRRSPEQQDLQINAVTNELRRLIIRLPENNPADLLMMARNNVNARSAYIGGDWVVMAKNIKSAMFKGKVANYDQDGIEHTAIIAWLNSPAMKTAHAGIARVGLDEQLFPFLGELSMADSNAALRRGARPFKSYVGGNGELYIQYQAHDGNLGDTIRIDLDAVGEYWMNRTDKVSDLR